MRKGWAIALILIAGSALGQPRIDSVTPAQGPIGGGTAVTLTGVNFTGATIKLDRTTAMTPLSRSGTQIQVQMPAHPNGYALIQVGSANAEFLYVPPRLSDLPAGYITTVAGMGAFARDYGPAKQANIGVWSIKREAGGNIYVADASHGRVYKVLTNGTIDRFAGGGTSRADGIAATDSVVAYTRDVAVDGAGNVYLGSNECAIRKVDASGTITTFAGNYGCGFSGDGGSASDALIGLPTYLVADASDLFFIDFDAKRIRRVHLADNQISTFAGNGSWGFSGDGGAATAASFYLQNNDLGGLALDPGGNVYLADVSNGRIRRIDRTTGIITTFYVPTPNTVDYVNEIRSLTFDPAGNLYYAGSGRVVKMSLAGALLTTYGNGTYAYPVDGSSAATTGLGHVMGLAIDGAGNILYADETCGRVRRINPSTLLIDTIAGSGLAMIGENGPAIAAPFLAIGDLAFLANGNLMMTDGSYLRVLDASGNLLTYAGAGPYGHWAPGSKFEITIAPTGIVIEPDGTIDLSDLSVVDHIDASGNLQWTVGHNADCALTGDGGPATQATLCQAWDIARDAGGSLFIADTNNNRVRRVDASTGIITTVAGSGPTNGYEHYGSGTSSGDGGPALDAQINTPYGIAFDDAGNLFIQEGGGIRRVDHATGIISRFADGVGTKLLWKNGNLFTAAAFVARISRSGVMTPLTALATGFEGDGGPASAARIFAGSQASGLAVDAEGNLFFSDSFNLRVRAIRYGAVLAPPNATIQLSAAGATIHATVRDARGDQAEGVRVDFTAPSTGPSCTLSSPFAITDINGVATVSCISNCVAGTYDVTAQPLTAIATANAHLTNGSGPCRTSSITLASTPNPSNAGQGVTLTASIATTPSGSASGSVSFFEGASTLGSAAISGNQASITISTLPSGVHSITAGYSGDATYLASTSPALVHVVNNSGFGMPVSFSATATTTSSVTLVWAGWSGAAHYELVRSSGGGAFLPIASPAVPWYADSGLVAGTTYVYKVRAKDGSDVPSGFSPPDAATTIVFNDDPLVPGTTIKAYHLAQLRQAVNAMLGAASLPAMTFTDAAVPGTIIKALHVAQLRAALDQARSAIGLPPLTYVDASLALQHVKVTHFRELREGCK